MDIRNSIVQELHAEVLSQHNVRLFVKRDDLIDEHISGNKWRKLKHNVALAKQKKMEGILTFGGAYSNHLLATAAACQQEGLHAIGIVRGDELNEQSNPTLRDCSAMGMQLVFVSREIYKQRYEKMWHEELTYEFPNHLIVPEGGANFYGIIGCQEILKEVEEKVDHIFVAQGTTATSCGILLSMNNEQTLHVVPALKGFEAKQEMQELHRDAGIPKEDWQEGLTKTVVHSDYHFGGYGKVTDELLHFMKEFEEEMGLPLDPVYTGKTMFALIDQVSNGALDGTSVLFVHTGGLQGRRGFE